MGECTRFLSSSRLRMVFFALIVVTICAFGLLSFSPRIAHAANGEVYPAPITEFLIPTNNSQPDGITTGPDHNLWFTEYNTNKIGRSTPGGVVTDFPLPSSSSDPTGITAGPDGNLWFTERYGNNIGRITPGGNITDFPHSYTSVDPGSITTGPDGNLWFTEYGGAIGRITPNGGITDFSIPNSSINPGRITSGPDGNLWFTAISQVGRITPHGVVTDFSLNNGYAFPGGITAGPDGDLWFTEQNSSGNAIGRITPHGVITDFPLPTVTYPDRTTWSIDPSEITAGPDGNLWFTSNQSLIGRITPNGDITEFVPLNSNSFGCCIAPTGITAGPDGNLWFADYGHNKVGYLTLGGTTPTPTPTSLPSPTSTPSPTPTPCAVVAGTTRTTQCTPKPCPKNAPVECLLASSAAYGLDTNNFVAPSGMTMLVRSDYINSSWRSDGFEAVALQDRNGNIIIANEGSLAFATSTSRFAVDSGIADLAVMKDQTPKALKDAKDFAQRVITSYSGSGNMYVTGHSLGGIEAEAEAEAFPSNIAGGATFGATGLPGNATPGGPQSFINYIDYGDTVGNYASDSNSQLNDHTVGLMYHYGQVQLVGSPLNASNLQIAAVTRDAALSPYLEGTGTVKARENQAILNLCMTINAADAAAYHKTHIYASDLHITLPSTETVPTLSGNDIGLTYDEELGTAGLTNVERTTEQTNGTVNSPDTTISSNPQTDQISIRDIANVHESWGTVAAGGTATLYIDPSSDIVSSVKYISPDGSQYLVQIDYNGHVDNIKINPIQGGSYQITYDTTNSQSWNSSVNIYTRRNEQGTLIETIYNWRIGGSQVQLFTGLPRGDTKEIKNYSGKNGTGTLLSISYK